MDLRTVVIDAIADHRPAIVLAFADDVDLVAAARAVLNLPEIAGCRIEREALSVAVAAAGEALRDSALDLERVDRSRVAVDIGTSLGGTANVEEQIWPVGNLWHAPAYTVPGRLLGLSPIQHHATEIGKGMAAGLHGFQYFSDGAHPTSIW